MKSKIKILSLVTALLATVALLAPPSASAMGWLFKPQGVTYVPFTNTVLIVQTNALGQPVATNQVQQTGVSAQTNYAINPVVQTGLQTGNTVASFIPEPFGAAVTVGLSGLSAILGLLLNKKNGQLSTANTIVQSVVQGVETAGDIATKLSIQSHATAAGVQDNLHQVVVEMTAAPVGAILKAPVTTPK